MLGAESIYDHLLGKRIQVFLYMGDNYQIMCISWCLYNENVSPFSAYWSGIWFDSPTVRYSPTLLPSIEKINMELK